MQAAMNALQPHVAIAINSSMIYFQEAYFQAGKCIGATTAAIPLLHIGSTGEGCGPRYLNMYRTCNKVLTLTDYERDWLRKQNLDQPSIATLGGGPDYAVNEVDDSKGSPIPDESSPWILFLARKVPTKGYRLVLQAMQRVWKVSPNAMFFFAGMPTPEWEADFASYATDPRVKDMGKVTDAHRIDMLRQCTLLCVPSTAESFGMMYLEAWRFAKPVIAVNTAVSQEIVGQHQGGLLAETNSDSVADAIIRLISDPQLARQMGENGRNAYLQKYNWNSVANRFIELFDLKPSS